MDIKALPKIDLHCHLDGSLTKAFIQKHFQYEVTEDQLTAPAECASLAEYLEKFDMPLKCLQTEKDLEEGSYTFMESLVGDNMKYIEVRFSPVLCANEKIDESQVIDAVRKGLERGKKEFGIHYGIICCAMRHHGPETNLRCLHAAREFYKNGVVAMDLAGGEAAYPNSLFKDFFAELRRCNMPFTIHSGETGNIQNVKDAFYFGASRIGHGIALAQDSEWINIIAKEGIGIEMCPSSNFQTKAVHEWNQYPLIQFLEAGIPVSINTDNRTVSNTTMTQELQLIYEQYGRDEELIRRLILNAAKTAFSEEIRESFEI